MKLQVVSDLHIEYNTNNIINPLDYITPSGDILILAGDIGSLYKQDQLIYFIKEISCYFVYVLYIPGNSEYYKQPNYQAKHMNELKLCFDKIESETKNVIVLDRKSVCIDNLCIVGATLWSDAKCDLPSYIIRIHEINKDIYKSMFTTDLSYINYMIDYCGENKLKMICVTHHAPTYQCLIGSNRHNDKFISLYVSPLDELLTSEKIKLWICGHIHYNFDFITSTGTRVVGNMKGKLKDNIQDYKMDFVISV